MIYYNKEEARFYVDGMVFLVYDMPAIHVGADDPKVCYMNNQFLVMRGNTLAGTWYVTKYLVVCLYRLWKDKIKSVLMGPKQ